MDVRLSESGTMWALGYPKLAKGPTGTQTPPLLILRQCAKVRCKIGIIIFGAGAGFGEERCLRRRQDLQYPERPAIR
jgi:hypothetical protein